jgi:hemerythrin superfamily protein
MSFIDRIASALAPAATAEQRAEARKDAENLARREEWVAVILDHHQQIETLVSEAMTASGADARRTAMRDLGKVLTGHATAEEAVLYPAISEYDGKAHAGMGYEEHAMTKIQMAKLERLDPMSEEWTEKLEHIRSALQQHMYEEEGSWLPGLAANLPAAEKAMLTARFNEEFDRYCGNGKGVDTGLSTGANTRTAMGDRPVSL